MQCKGILTRAGRNAVNKSLGTGSYIITATVSRGTPTHSLHSIGPCFGRRPGRGDHCEVLEAQPLSNSVLHRQQCAMIRKRLLTSTQPCAASKKEAIDARCLYAATVSVQLTLALSTTAITTLACVRACVLARAAHHSHHTRTHLNTHASQG